MSELIEKIDRAMIPVNIAFNLAHYIKKVTAEMPKSQKKRAFRKIDRTPLKRKNKQRDAALRNEGMIKIIAGFTAAASQLLIEQSKPKDLRQFESGGYVSSEPEMINNYIRHTDK